MPTLVPYHLAFRGGLHLGTRGVNLEEAGQTIPSDTLFSAVLVSCMRQGMDVAAFAETFVAQPPDPPFLLTSAFPRVGSVRFYPLPAALERILKPETIRQGGKAVRRIRYLSEGLLKKALSGSSLDDDLFPVEAHAEPMRGAALQGGALWFGLDEMAQMPADFQRDKGKRHALTQLTVWKQERVPRVTISRISQASNVYSAGRTTFHEGCGLWFGVSWRNPEAQLPGGPTYLNALNTAVSMLQHDGLGGERTAGYGAFELEVCAPIMLGKDPQPNHAAWLLSRYHPRPDELPFALDPALQTAYTLSAVSGWLNSPDSPAQRRKRLYMVNEGSMVTLATDPAGDVTDVRPVYDNSQGNLSHPVYRYGLALGLGW